MNVQLNIMSAAATTLNLVTEPNRPQHSILSSECSGRWRYAGRTACKPAVTLGRLVIRRRDDSTVAACNGDAGSGLLAGGAEGRCTNCGLRDGRITWAVLDSPSGYLVKDS
jgi:hypothetical protein